MESVTATATWSREADRYCLLADFSAGSRLAPEPFSDDALLASVLLERDDEDRDTGRVAGVEIVGFLGFDRWEDVPSSAVLWKLPGAKAVPLKELLRREQERLRNEAGIRV